MEMLQKEQKRKLLNLYIDCNIEKDFFVKLKSRKAFFIVDLNGHIAYVNQICERLTGYASDELLSLQAGRLFALTELDNNQYLIKDNTPETLSTVETKLIDKNGKQHGVIVSFFPIYFMGVTVGTFFLLKKMPINIEFKKI